MLPLLRRLTALVVAALTLPLVGACGDEATTDDGPIGSIVEAGKSDNFFAVSAREYYVEGTMSVVLDASWSAKTEDQRLAEVKRLIPFKQVVVGWFLNVYIVDKESKSGEPTYGGFKALTKNGAYEDMNIKKLSDLTYSFDFRQQVGGQEDLIGALPDAKVQGDGSWNFDLVIGKVSNTDIQRLDTDREWYRDSPWGSFDPSKVADDKKEILPLRIRQQPAEDDAWMEHERLMADGLLTVGVHFGWDYHGAYHEKHSKDVYDWLTRTKGFKSPVASYDLLRHDSGPLTGTTKYRGKSVRVEVSLFWGQKGLATDPDTAAGGKQLEDDMRTSLKEREVVIFSGHSGPFYGFALANWKVTSEGDFDDSELMEAELMVGSYQLVVAEGCDTYALGQAFALNPDKPGLVDLDVITTTSFSNASSSGTIKDTLSALIGTSGTSSVTKWSQLMEDLDANSSWFTTMYGVHGLDDNPRVHPWADLAKSCKSCTSNGQCGDGMRCVKMADGKSACAAECTATVGCGAGYECRNVAVDRWLEAKVCAPESLKCGVAVTAGPKVLVSEIMARPGADYNGDGTTSATSDEYVEIVNAGAAPAVLTGWSLSDSYGVRHVFGNGATIPPGGAMIVFAGGTPSLVAGTTIVTKASTGALGLNDTGDTVKLADVDRLVVATVKYGSGVAKGQSWTRERELDATATFSAAAPSPGTKKDGSNY
ncbi:MAG: lamin tail domain-containing protein [Deltaproteobacteria bacterium]|nr:lamin tail domain-containing protein [Deltaproteobacteria bacterium]